MDFITFNVLIKILKGLLTPTHIRSMDVGGYRYNLEGFYKKFTCIMSINKGQ